MPTTPNLEFDKLVEDQASAEVTANDTFNRADALVHMKFVTRALSAAPALTSPDDDGAVYLVAGTPAGGDAWEGHGSDLAFFYNGWLFLTPVAGMIGWLIDEAIFIGYDGAAWSEIGSGTGAPPRILAYKSALQTVASQTFVADEDLKFTAEAEAEYFFEITARITCQALPGIAHIIDFTGPTSPADVWYGAHVGQENQSPVDEYHVTAFEQEISIAYVSTEARLWKIYGAFTTSAGNGGEVVLRHKQFQSSGTSTIHRGSNLTAWKV